MSLEPVQQKAKKAGPPKLSNKKKKNSINLVSLVNKMNVVDIKLGYVAIQNVPIFNTIMNFLLSECGAGLEIFKIRMLSNKFKTIVTKYFDEENFR